ncbi:MAG: hypothetical protein Tsb009_35350 [Planctomycetaceae bacterium]
MKNLFLLAGMLSVVLFVTGCDEKKSDSKGSSADNNAQGDNLAGNPPGMAPGGADGYNPPGMESGDGSAPGSGSNPDNYTPPGMEPGSGSQPMPNPDNYNPPGLETPGSESAPGSGSQPMPNPDNYTPPGMEPGSGSQPMPNPDNYTPPGGANPGNFDSPPGVPGGAGNQTAKPPEYPEGSSEHAVVTLVMSLKNNKLKELAKVISPSAKGLMKDLRTGDPSAQTLRRAHYILGLVRASKKNATRLSDKSQQFTLINNRGNILRFTCVKEGEKYLIQDMKLERGRRRRR